ncbi:T9SS type A sorting domain-containing protein [Flavobacterium sp. RHBU_3]|uniref:T9SS type A sorting domain-containing protein n=1 Tax=Flavobacterium sp. RHBU_3 TaxID=3391184 RepID=UPI0039847177
MKKIILLLSLMPLIGFAQQFQWLKTPAVSMPYNPEMIGYSTAVDNQGNAIVIGFKDTPFIYSSIMGNLSLDKYNADGELLFSKTITGHVQPHNMVTDSNGNIYISLSYVNEISVDNIAISTVEQGELWLFAKFSAEGNIIWYRAFTPIDYGNNTYNEVADFNAITIDSNDNLYIGYSDFYKAFIEQISTEDGSVIKTIEQEHTTRIAYLATDNEGNIYATGACADNEATFAGEVHGTEFQYNLYLVKYNASGTFQWVKYVQDVTCPEPHVIVTGTNEIYFASFLWGETAFDDIIVPGSPYGMEDFFLAKLNSNGEYQWIKEVPAGGSFTLGNRNYLSKDEAGNVYISGRSRFDIDWGNGVTSTTGAFTYDASILKYNADGVVQFAKTIPSFYSRFDGASISNDGSIYLSGMALGPITADTFSYDPQQTEEYYPYFTKLSPDTTATVDKIQDKGIYIYPNPATDKVYFSGVTTDIKGDIINVLGQNISSFSLSAGQPLDVSALPPGNYFLKTDGLPTIKLIKTAN